MSGIGAVERLGSPRTRGRSTTSRARNRVVRCTRWFLGAVSFVAASRGPLIRRVIQDRGDPSKSGGSRMAQASLHQRGLTHLIAPKKQFSNLPLRWQAMEPRRKKSEYRRSVSSPIPGRNRTHLSNKFSWVYHLRPRTVQPPRTKKLTFATGSNRQNSCRARPRFKRLPDGITLIHVELQKLITCSRNILDALPPAT